MKEDYLCLPDTSTSGKNGKPARDSHLLSEKKMTARNSDLSSRGVASRFLHALLQRALGGDDLSTTVQHVFVRRLGGT